MGKRIVLLFCVVCMLLMVGVLPTGCGPMTWKVDSGRAQGHVGTQFSIGYRSTGEVFFGFPGELTANAEGSAQGSHTPEPTTETDVTNASDVDLP